MSRGMFPMYSAASSTRWVSPARVTGSSRQEALLTQRELRAHLEAKRQENVFEDVIPFLAVGVNYDWHVAYDWLESTILPRLP